MVISEFGYLRVFVQEKGEEIESAYDEVEIILENDHQNFIHDSLEKLKAIESSYSVELTQGRKIKRNRELVEVLKSLYHGQCQICNPEYMLPPICRNDGSIYSEVHHITSIHTAECDEDIKSIDSYKNTIVLCPYHHKYVHYHHGGFNQIKENKDSLYLANEWGEKVKIFTNFHLSTDENEL